MLPSFKNVYPPAQVLKTNMFKTKLAKFGVSRRFQPAIYTVFDEEPESEVQNIKILQENLEISISFFF